MAKRKAKPTLKIASPDKWGELTPKDLLDLVLEAHDELEEARAHEQTLGIKTFHAMQETWAADNHYRESVGRMLARIEGRPDVGLEETGKAA